MTEVTRILSQIEDGDPSAADQLLPLIYDELRRLATSRLSNEKPGQTLQPTALVHEAYLRLIGDGGQHQHWDGRGHFFSAAAEAMRRIMVESARRKKSQKCGGGASRREVADSDVLTFASHADVLEVDEALERLAQRDKEAAQLVKLRFFAGLSSEQGAQAMTISPRSADRLWVYAKSFLYNDLKPD